MSKNLSFFEWTELFPTDEAAEKWFTENRWPDGVRCPVCDSDNIQTRPTRKPQPYRCRICFKDFSAKTNTLMHGSRLGYKKWMLAIYLVGTTNKSISSMDLHRKLGVTQKTAWFMAHRIREAYGIKAEPLTGTVEVDEAYFGGRKKPGIRGRGAIGKAPVFGMKSRETGKVIAFPIDKPSKKTLHKSINNNVARGSSVYSDGWKGYKGLTGFTHEVVEHSRYEFVREDIHTNGIESFWAILKRGYHGTFHWMSHKHLFRYVNEFVGRFNSRELDQLEQMNKIARSMNGKRLKYVDLIL